MDGIFTALRTNMSGLQSQMKRLNAISENIANAETLPDENGKVYQRKLVVDESAKSAGSATFGEKMRLSIAQSSGKHLGGTKRLDGAAGKNNYHQFSIEERESEKLVFDPTNPKADAQGYVKVPDINIVEEMVDMIAASRAYEANVTTMEAAKKMAQSTMRI
ncbi:MAG TPA: flagellar basal body rod protein FlgC [Candidatus Marinimicrobia bacterium]|nr:flagellar basal body rod protein FlgC [Candidatus Neomarinimicrobiota bacterium]